MSDWPGQEVTAGAQGGGPALRTVMEIPNPEGVRDNAREDREESRGIEKDRADRIVSLFEKFEGNPSVQTYREALPQYVSGLESADDARGDLQLLTAYAKVMDPAGVVRSSDEELIMNANSRISSTIQSLKKDFGIGQGGTFTDEVRRGLRREMHTRIGNLEQANNTVRDRYSALAKGVNADPSLVVGEDFGATFAPTIESFWAGQDKQPEIATAQDAINSGGAELEFGMDGWGKNDVFDRLEYLQDQYGVGPDEEARLVASLNKLSGQEVGIGQLAAIYAGLGMQPPSDADLQQTAQQLKEGYQIGGFDTSSAEQQYIEGLQQFREEQGDGRNDEALMVEQGATLGLSDEIYGLTEGARALLTGGDPVAGYQVGRDADRLAQEQARSNLGAKGTALEIGAGLTTGGLRLVPALAKAGMRAAPNAINEARAAGAVAGYGYGEGAVESGVGAVAGAVTGDLAARGIGKLADKFKGRAATPEQQAGREVMEAADRTNARTGSNIEPMPADVGGANVRRATAGAAQTTFGASDIVKASQKVTDEAQGAVETLASREGQVGTRQATGEQAIQGADKSMKRLKTKVDSLYTKARKLSGDTRVPLTNATAALDQHLAEVADTPGGSNTAKVLLDLREGIEGDWKPEGIRRMRTEWRDKFVKDNLRGSDQERRINDIIDQAELDIEQGLSEAGKVGAAKAWKDASKAAAERYQLIDDVITPILGKKGDQSGEGAYAAIDRLSRGDAVALGKFMKALPSEEAGAIRATVISRLGRSTKGQQEADGEAFSLARFLTNWNDEGLSKEAKSALFSGELRVALDDVARVAQGSKEAMRYANHSNTSGGNFFNMLINGAPLGAAFYDVGTAAAAGGGAVLAQKISGKMLSSPGFARWLARSAKIEKPGAARAHAQGLSKIASKDAAISAEIIDFQGALLQQLEGAPSRLAAEEDQSSAQAGASTGSPGAGQ